MGNDICHDGFYYGNMMVPEHDWYLADWMKSLSLKQARLVELTGWSKGKVSKLYNGKSSYDRNAVNEAAAALNLLPYELLMHPDEAMALRRLRDSALSIAADERLPYKADMEVDGTNG